MRDHKTIVPHKVEPPPAAPSRLGFFSRAGKSMYRVTTLSLATIGVGTVAMFAYDYWLLRDMPKGGKGKKVLVLPFHRMKLVETKSTTPLANGLNDTIEIEVSKLVEIIHAAAQDPSISALYGTFGHGFRFRSGGWAHVEEVRNALKVWRESHRVHLEPNLKHEKILNRPSNGASKPSYAYADTFASPDLMGNKEYLLACAFSHIHMQKNGELNLFGVSYSSVFLRSFMESHGIKAHVFKHGLYKNAPNMFTETGFTREHRQNLQNMVEHIDRNKRDAIVDDRNAKGFNPVVWKMIRKHGSFTGPQALKLGLVDHLPKLCPLDALLLSNTSKIAKSAMRLKLRNQTDVSKFDASRQISLGAYASLLERRKRRDERKWKLYRVLRKLSESNAAFKFTFGCFGLHAPFFNLKREEFSLAKATGEKIAVVNINGGITSALANSIVASLRQIKKDSSIKAVVLRVDSPGGCVTASETILQECMDINKPLICSMGNSCASGGYLIATACKRIFALPGTKTGSIGAYGVKFDLTGLAKKYGFSVQHITTGPYSASSDPFSPLNPSVKANFIHQIDRIYDTFKTYVSESRGLDMQKVEDLAQGKIWTGWEAVNNGLVDEVGGLERAIAFAIRNYSSGDAQVERWPKPEPLIHRLRKKLGSSLTGSVPALPSSIPTPISEYDAVTFLVQAILNDPSKVNSLELGGVYFAMDESSAIEQLVTRNAEQLQKPLLHPSIWSS